MSYWQDYDVMVVETPENLELRLPLSGFGPRFFAAALDSIFVALVQLVLLVALYFILLPLGLSGIFSIGSAPSTALIVVSIVALIFVMLLMPFAYFCYFEYRAYGQTPGKRIAGIRVVKAGGLPLTLTDVAVRNLMRIVDMLPQMGFAAWVSFFATRYQQRLGDLAAGTVVIREFRAGPPGLFPADSTDRYGALQIPVGALTPDLQEAISSYLQRSADFDLMTRLTVSSELIAALGYSGDTLPLDQREGYLNSIVRQAYTTAMQRETGG